MNYETGAAPDLATRTKEFSLRIIRMFCALPKSTLAQVLGKQVLRSGTSVGANFREAKRARSKPEFISKIGECLRELDETACWLELLADSAVAPSKKFSALHDECNQLLAILTKISKSAKSQKAQNISRPFHNS